MTLLLIAALTLTGPPGGPPKGDGDGIVAALEAIRDGERECRDLIVRYRDGDDERGRTTVYVAKGWSRVVREEPEQEKQIFRGRLPRGLCERLVRNALDGKLWATKRPKRRAPEPDETQPEIRFRVKEAGAFTVRMWDYEIQNRAVFAIARADLLQVARKVSDGAVLY